MYKVGQKVRITNNSSHNFKVGQVVEIVNVPDNKGEIYTLKGDLSHKGWTQRPVGTQIVYASQFQPALDLTKPVFTVEGTPVQIISTTGRDEKFPVLAYEGKAKNPSKYDMAGNSKTGVARRNLTNDVPVVEPEQPKEIFVNVYGGGILQPSTFRPETYAMSASIGGGRFTSEEEATAQYNLSVRRGNTHKRIGVAKLVMVRGDLPE